MLAVLGSALLGFVISRRVLGLVGAIECLSVAAGLAVSLGLLVANLVLRAGGTLATAEWVVALASVVAGGVLWKVMPAAESLKWPRPATWAFLLPSTALIYLLTNSQQLLTIDYDYWIHAPLQGHLLAGAFPPANPFFPELALAGHYGRDLLIVLLSHSFKLDLIRSQFLVTSFTHCLAYLIAVSLFRRFAQVGPAAILGPLFLLLGVNVGYITGLLEFHHNHSSPAYMQLLLLFFLLLRLREAPRPGPAIVLGTVLGAHAFVFITNFGLVLLAGSTVAILGAARHRGQRKFLLAWSGAAALAVLLSLFNGGVPSEMITRDGSPQPQSIMNQSQRPDLSFPKQPLFGIRIGAEQSDFVSELYAHAPFSWVLAKLDHKARRLTPEYAPLWGWEVFKMHGLGLLLLPLTLWAVWKQRRNGGCGELFLAFGIWAYLIPGLIHFGPVHEAEYLRWEYAAGFGFSGALAVVMSWLFDTRKRALQVLVGAVCCINVWGGLVHLGTALKTLPQAGTVWQILTLANDPEEWLNYHALELGIREGDLEALRYLRGRTKPGQTILLNFPGETRWQMQLESTLANLTGLYPLGHQLPQDEELIGTPPSRMTPQCRDFLAEPTVEALNAINADWLYINEPTSETVVNPKLEQLSELDKVFEFHSPRRRLCLYRRRQVE